MRILILNQAFHPDVVATAQHATDLALGLVEAGHEVTVVCSSRAYDNASVRFPRREVWQGIAIHRISALGLGKRAKWRRACDFAWFFVGCALRLVRLGRFDVVVSLTSPPLISFLAAILLPVTHARLVCWTMDMNPDEAMSAGWLKEQSLVGRLLVRAQHVSLRRATRVVALDHFMRDRIVNKGIPQEKITVIAPWAHDQDVQFDPIGRDVFRAEYGLTNKFVVMYSGNHSPCHPLDTLLDAARSLRERDDIAFVFAGGGSEKSKVEAARATGLRNILSLPYQPRQKLAASLSAADLHVVVMGDAFVGIVHPCKIYNILAVGAPVLYIGPEASHISELPGLFSAPGNLSVRHGQVMEVVEHIRLLADRAVAPRNKYSTFPFSKAKLLPEMIAAIGSTRRDSCTSLAAQFRKVTGLEPGLRYFVGSIFSASLKRLK